MRNSIRVLAEVAMASALSIVLSLVVFYRLPQGGTVDLAMLPVFIMSYRRGPWVGILTGVLAGVLQMITDPFFVHPLQIALDYFLAWGAIGLAGIIPLVPVYTVPRHTAGALVGMMGRFVFHYLSGVWFFAQYAPPEMKLWYYVSSYILSHLIPATALCFVVCAIPAVRRLCVVEGRGQRFGRGI